MSSRLVNVRKQARTHARTRVIWPTETSPEPRTQANEWADWIEVQLAIPVASSPAPPLTVQLYDGDVADEDELELLVKVSFPESLLSSPSMT